MKINGENKEKIMNYLKDLVPKNSNKEVIKIEGHTFYVENLEGGSAWANGSHALLRESGSYTLVAPAFAMGSNPRGGEVYVSTEGDWVSARTKIVDNIPVHDGYERVKPSKRVLLQGGRLELLVF